MTVKCSDGSAYNADHVIVSVPLGVLKHNYTTLFTPPLPKIKKNAIQGISFGTVGKIYLEFEKPWWPNDWVGLSLLWTKEDIEKIKSTENYWFVMLMKMLAGWKVSKLFFFVIPEKVGVNLWILLGGLPAERAVRMDLWAESLLHGAA